MTQIKSTQINLAERLKSLGDSLVQVFDLDQKHHSLQTVVNAV
jgi:hypothetical protein